jgi:DNA mismatch repair protein MutL
MASYQEDQKSDLFGTGSHEPKASADIPPGSRTAAGKHSYLPWDKRQPPHGQSSAATSEPEKLFHGQKISFTAVPKGRKLSTVQPAAPVEHFQPLTDSRPEDLRPIGQLMDLYLLCELTKDGESSLVVIDQHAAHERIIFENLKKQFAENQIASQNLMFPKMLELSPESADALEKHRQEIEQFGLEIEEFGGDNYVIKAVPAIFSHLDPEEIVTGFLSQYTGPESGKSNGRRLADATRLDDILATMACKAAVKAGHPLQNIEVQELLKLMQESDAFSYCPHGRPVVRSFDTQEIKKWFLRT